MPSKRAKRSRNKNKNNNVKRQTQQGSAVPIKKSKESEESLPMSLSHAQSCSSLLSFTESDYLDSLEIMREEVKVKVANSTMISNPSLSSKSQDTTNDKGKEAWQIEIESRLLSKTNEIIELYHYKTHSKILDTQRWVLEQQTRLLKEVNSLFNVYRHNTEVVAMLGFCPANFRRRTKLVSTGLHEIQELLMHYECWKVEIEELIFRSEDRFDTLIQVLQPIVYETLEKYYELKPEDHNIDKFHEQFKEIVQLPKDICESNNVQDLLTQGDVTKLKEELEKLNLRVDTRLVRALGKLWEVSIEFGIRKPPARL